MNSCSSNRRQDKPLNVTSISLSSSSITNGLLLICMIS
jgi:hypothetical protein